MRNHFIILAFFFVTTFVTAQKEVVDFDVVDSLYREDQFYLTFTYNNLNKSPNGVKQNKFSPGVSFGFLRDMPINKNRTFSVASGLGYAIGVYNQNLMISENNGNYNYQILTPGTYSKDKLSLHYIDLPIEVRWRTSTPDSHKFWRIYSGIRLRYLLYDEYRLVTSDANYKISNSKDLSQFHYGAYLSTGWNTWNFHVYYGLSPLFKSSAKIDDESIKMKTFNVGLMFYIL
jgi:hypothetical protein